MTGFDDGACVANRGHRVAIADHVAMAIVFEIDQDLPTSDLLRSHRCTDGRNEHQDSHKSKKQALLLLHSSIRINCYRV